LASVLCAGAWLIGEKHPPALRHFDQGRYILIMQIHDDNIPGGLFRPASFV
jgi:hypothetical protein